MAQRAEQEREEAARRAALRQHRERERRRKEKEQKQKEQRERAVALLAKAAAHDASRLQRWYGWRAWRVYVEDMRRNREEAQAHRRQQLLASCFAVWMQSYRDREAQALSRAHAHFEQQLQQRFLQQWRSQLAALSRLSKAAWETHSRRACARALFQWRQQTRREQQRMLHLERVALHLCHK